MDGLRINHEEQKIILTRQFAKESENDSSPAYRRLVEVRKEFDYKVEVRSIKKTAKESYKGLNIKYIERYVKKYDNKDGVKMKTLGAKRILSFGANMNTKTGSGSSSAPLYRLINCREKPKKDYLRSNSTVFFPFSVGRSIVKTKGLEIFFSTTSFTTI